MGKEDEYLSDSLFSFVLNNVNIAVYPKSLIDGIVNAANSKLKGGGGIDGAIRKAAGPELDIECQKKNGCKIGSTVVTKGYKLNASYVLHSVGPHYSVTDNPNETLSSCYRTILEQADEYKMKSICICCISCGLYGFPLEDACKIALKTTVSYLKNNRTTNLTHIFFSPFKEEEKTIYEREFRKYYLFIKDHVGKEIIVPDYLMDCDVDNRKKRMSEKIQSDSSSVSEEIVFNESKFHTTDDSFINESKFNYQSLDEKVDSKISKLKLVPHSDDDD